MAIEKKKEVRTDVDIRTVDRKVGDFLSQTPATYIALVIMSLIMLASPWTLHLFLPVALIWYSTVAFDRKRQMLPYYLPVEAGRTDYNQPKPGGQVGFEKANGIFFIGNADEKFYEIWESSGTARQHKLIFGTTGAGKSQLLMGMYVQYLIVGAGCIFSDAKGTPEMVSQLYRASRRFLRDVDFFSLNYISGGITFREGKRDRTTNMSNPVAFASADQVIQMFSAFLPKSSGDNQIFQERAMTMFAALAPALVDLRDLHSVPLGVNVIRDYVTNLNKILELAFDSGNRLTEFSRDTLRKYLSSLPNFNLDEFLGLTDAKKKFPNYKIEQETSRMFGFASQYFTRALSVLSDGYRQIYATETGELDWLDAVINRRIVVVSLPALEKAPPELLSLAKINLANIRGAIAIAMGDKIEGRRKETLDFLPSKSETPTGIILDEYGYQATEGFAITTAQARSLNFAITIAGQDLSNLEMGSKDEAEAIFGNAVLITLNIRNVKGIGDRIRDTVGQADIAVDSGHEKNTGGLMTGYQRGLNASIQQRYRINPNDLVSLGTGEAFIYVGRNIGTIRFYPYAPNPPVADYMRVNRFLPVRITPDMGTDQMKLIETLSTFALKRIEGSSKPMETGEVPIDVALMVKNGRRPNGHQFESFMQAILDGLANPKEAGAPSPATAQAPRIGREPPAPASPSSRAGTGAGALPGARPAQPQPAFYDDDIDGGLDDRAGTATARTGASGLPSSGSPYRAPTGRNDIAAKRLANDTSDLFVEPDPITADNVRKMAGSFADLTNAMGRFPPHFDDMPPFIIEDDEAADGAPSKPALAASAPAKPTPTPQPKPATQATDLAVAQALKAAADAVAYTPHPQAPKPPTNSTSVANALERMRKNATKGPPIKR